MAKKQVITADQGDAFFGFNDAVIKSLSKYNAIPTQEDHVEKIDTGSAFLNWLTGGGIPRGRLTQIVGNEDSGKTFMSSLITRYITRHSTDMKNGGLVAVFDAENKYSIEGARNMGIDMRRLKVFQRISGEDALNIALELIKANAVDMIVIDSVPSMLFSAMEAGDMNNAHVGLQARKFSQFWNMACNLTAKSHVALVTINQYRDNIGDTYGPKEREPGGRSISRFAPSLKIKMLAPKHDEEKRKTADGEIITIDKLTLRPRVTKNHVTFRRNKPDDDAAGVSVIVSAFAPLIDEAYEAATVGKQLGVFVNSKGLPINAAGYWYFRGVDESNRIGNGMVEVRAALEQDDDLMSMVRHDLAVAIEAGNHRPVTLDDYPEE